MLIAQIFERRSRLLYCRIDRW